MSDGVEAPPPAGAGGKWWTIGVLGLATFVLTLNDTAPAVAMPAIGRDLGLGVTGLEWVVNSYTLALAVSVLPGGRLADLFGRRRLFVLGLAIFTLASLGAGLATSGGPLIAFRAVQGVGGGLMMPAALAIISTSFAPSRRGAAIGLWAGISSSALAVGPLVGALVTERLSWSWIFLLNAPLGLAGLAAARLLAPDLRVAGRRPGLDLPGLVLSAAVLLALVFALTEGPAYGWSAPLTLGLLGTAALGLVAFLCVELHAGEAMLDLSLFRRRSFAGANVVTLLATSVMCSVFFFLSLYLQLALGYSAIGAGAVFLPMTVLIFLLAPLAGRLSDRVGRRLPLVAGLLLLAAGLFVLSGLGLDTGLARLLLGLTIVGVGVALTTTPATATALDSAPADQSGLVSGILNTSRMVGLALGIATMGAIVAAQWPRGFVQASASPRLFAAGLASAFLVNAVIAAVTAVIAALALSGRRPVRAGIRGRHAFTRSADHLRALSTFGRQCAK